MARKSTSSIFCLLFFYSFLTASAPINVEDHHSGYVEMNQMIPSDSHENKELRKLKKEERKLIRFEKTMLRFNKILHSKKNQGAIGIFSDPVGRWFWIWLIAWGFGIALTIIARTTLTGGFLGVVWISAFVIGGIALIIWLKKKFG